MYKTMFNIRSLHIIWSSLKPPNFFVLILSKFIIFLVGNNSSTFCESGLLHHFFESSCF